MTPSFLLYFTDTSSTSCRKHTVVFRSAVIGSGIFHERALAQRYLSIVLQHNTQQTTVNSKIQTLFFKSLKTSPKFTVKIELKIFLSSEQKIHKHPSFAYQFFGFEFFYLQRCHIYCNSKIQREWQNGKFSTSDCRKKIEKAGTRGGEREVKGCGTKIWEKGLSASLRLILCFPRSNNPGFSTLSITHDRWSVLETACLTYIKA